MLFTLASTPVDGQTKEGFNNGIPPGHMIIEGDIIVPLDFFEREAVYATNLWPANPADPLQTAIIPYEFDANVTPGQQVQAIQAMAEWEAVANVDFRPRNGEANFLHIQNAGVNSSFVGMQGGIQVINIASWNQRFVIAHELAHALGYWHEQSRADRDTYIQVNLGNIQGGHHNFAIRWDQGPLGSGEYGLYDYDSVMHYGECAFSACANCPNDVNCPEGGRTITVLPGGMTDCCFANGTPGCDESECTALVCALDPFCCNVAWDATCAVSANALCGICIDMLQLFGCNNPTAGPNGCQSHIGQRDHLSHFDNLTMSFLYRQANWRFVDQAYAGNQVGTFLQPYTQFPVGEANTPSGGTLWVQPGTYVAAGTYTKSITIRAPLGSVTLD